MKMARWVGLIIVVVGLIGGGLPESAKAQSQAHILAIEWSPNGQRIVVGYGDGTLQIWNASNQTIEKNLSSHDGVTTLAWNPSGTQLASADKDQLRVWDATNGQLIKIVQSGYWVTAMTWNRDATRLITFRSDMAQNTMQVWNATTAAFLLAQEQDSIDVTDLEPDLTHQIFVASTFDGTLEVRSSVDLRSLAMANEILPTTASFSPDGQQIVSGTAQGTLRIWAIPDNLGRNGPLPELLPIHSLRVVTTPLVYPITYIWDTKFSLSGNRVYSVSGSGEFAEWDASDGTLISTTQLENAPISAAAFNQLGTKLAYGDVNGELHIVDVATLVPPETYGELPTFFRISDGQAASRLLQ